MFDAIANKILEEVHDLPSDSGPDYVAEYVLRRFREIMAAQEVVLYQP